MRPEDPTKKKSFELWVELAHIEGAALFFLSKKLCGRCKGQNIILSRPQCPPPLICNYHTHYIKFDLEKTLKLGGMHTDPFFSKFGAAVKKLVAHVSALV